MIPQRQLDALDAYDTLDDGIRTPGDEAHALRAENERPRRVVKSLEGALRCANKVLAPYAGRAGQ